MVGRTKEDCPQGSAQACLNTRAHTHTLATDSAYSYSSLLITHHNCLTALYTHHPPGQKYDLFKFPSTTACLANIPQETTAFISDWLSVPRYTTPEEWFTLAITSDIEDEPTPFGCITFSGLDDMFSTQSS